MDMPKQDVAARLSAAIEEWNAQIVETHENLSQQIAAAQRHLDSIASPGEGDTASSEMQAELERLNQELTERDARIADLESAVTGLREEIAALQTTAEEEASAREHQTAQIESLERELETARREIAQAQEDASHIRQQTRDDAPRLAALEYHLEDARAEASRFQEEAASAQSRIAELEAQLDAAASLAEELKQAREERDQAVAEVQRLRGEPGPAPAPPKIVDLSRVKVFDARGHKKRMGQILVEAGIITQEQLEDILNKQASSPQRRFGTLVVEHGHTSEEVVARILAAQLRLPFTELKESDVDPAATMLVGPHLADLHQCIPIRKEEDRLTLAMANPIDLIAIEDVELATRCRVEPVVATPTGVRRAIAQYCYRPPD